MVRPEGLQAGLEEEVLAGESILPTTFHQLMPGLHLEGGRRPLRVPLRELRYELNGTDLNLEFFLPKGSYATTFLREIMKREEVPPSYGPFEPDELSMPSPAPAPAPPAPTGPPEPPAVPQMAPSSTAEEGPRLDENDLEADDEPPVG
jgi:hypothetical protein